MSEDHDEHGHSHDGDEHGHSHDGDEHGHSHDGDEHGHGHDGDDHHHAHDLSELGIAVVTISSSRTLEEDPSGDFLETTLEEAGHDVVVRELIPDDFDSVQATMDRLSAREDTDAVIATGGTGVTPDDVTPEAVRQLFDKQLPGFGELFRRLSYDEVGTKTVGSRATAGVADGVPVFCLPGSENAVRLGLEEIILPEIGHLAGLASRD